MKRKNEKASRLFQQKSIDKLRLTCFNLRFLCLKYVDEITTSNLNGVKPPAFLFLHYDLHEFDALNLIELNHSKTEI